ncbi:unnamed protein product [Amoebophrya sp. A25]|nr:unnamed protein product [Amoebophrya sp. A25]|eukprot:GSA25T00009212001.1
MLTSKQNVIFDVVRHAARSLEYNLNAYENAKRENSKTFQSLLKELEQIVAKTATQQPAKPNGAADDPPDLSEEFLRRWKKMLRMELVDREVDGSNTGASTEDHEVDSPPALDRYRKRMSRPDVRAEDFAEQAEWSREGIGDAVRSIGSVLRLDGEETFL